MCVHFDFAPFFGTWFLTFLFLGTFDFGHLRFWTFLLYKYLVFGTFYFGQFDFEYYRFLGCFICYNFYNGNFLFCKVLMFFLGTYEFGLIWFVCHILFCDTLGLGHIWFCDFFWDTFDFVTCLILRHILFWDTIYFEIHLVLGHIWV